MLKKTLLTIIFSNKTFKKKLNLLIKEKITKQAELKVTFI